MPYETLESLRQVQFLPVPPLCDEELELVLASTWPLNEAAAMAPTYQFHMRLRDSGIVVGEITLRIGNLPKIITYFGHIGYHVDPPYRGNRYAARSCRLIFPLARAHGLNPLWITCNPDNWASRRTCELAGGVLVDIVDLPPDNPLYRRGERQKCRYRFDL
ncbi:MAG: GNAT family N-acetyltransferase [Anaerolineae bacterium]|nr:GNAT family N-acetyltransferase [Thermoflexales bacterium]MDW8396249.1 GNAT family N-acetyltransferase [Anaerolineae bacterium]